MEYFSVVLVYEDKNEQESLILSRTSAQINGNRASEDISQWDVINNKYSKTSKHILKDALHPALMICFY